MDVRKLVEAAQGSLTRMANWKAQAELDRQLKLLAAQEEAEKRAWSPGETTGVAPLAPLPQLPMPAFRPGQIGNLPSPSLLRPYDPFARSPEVREGIGLDLPGGGFLPPRTTTPKGYRFAAEEALTGARTQAAIKEMQASWGRPLSPEVGAQIGEERRTTERQRKAGAEQVAANALTEMDNLNYALRSDPKGVDPASALAQLQRKYMEQQNTIRNAPPSVMLPEDKQAALAALDKKYSQLMAEYGGGGPGIEQMFETLRQYGW